MDQQQQQPPSQAQLSLKYGRQLSLQLRAGHAISRWKKFSGRTKNRYYRLRQLVTTQKDYHSDLITIRDHIKKPLKEQALISENEERNMFANIESMIQLSAEMNIEFTILFQNWNRHTTLLGSVMKKYSKFLLVYSDYFKNLNHTQNVLKNLVRTNPKAKAIEQSLSSEEDNLVITVQNMMSKPFQRPLKYHLILRDYASKVPKKHPDAQVLAEAIECYHEVNEQNNIALQDKQKNIILVDLDKRFGQIIDKGARYYISQYESILIDKIVDLYLFSNLLMIAERENSQKVTRLYLDKWSYVEKPNDGHYFTNRLFVYGKKECIHLSFFTANLRNEFKDTLSRVIADIKINEITREEKINSGRWTSDRMTRSTFNSIAERQSFTQSSPQTKRPMVVTILGNDERTFEDGFVIDYYVLLFHAVSPRLDQITPPHQIAYVSEQKMFQIETMVKDLYPGFEFIPLNSTIRGRNKSEIDRYKDMRHEIHAIFIQLMLNLMFRNRTISKRLDIFAHLLGISDALWEDIVTPSRCELKGCQICMEESIYGTFQDYVREQKQRFFRKNEQLHNKMMKSLTKIRFCQRKTLQMRQALQEVPLRNIYKQKLEVRLEWLKSRFGWINYVFAESRPRSFRMTTKIYFCNVTNSTEGLQIEFCVNERIRHLRSKIGERLRVNLQDYTILANIGESMHVLEEDETLGQIVLHPQPEEGFFSSFFKKQPYKMSFWLRKIWFFEPTLELDMNERKLHLVTQELIFRIKCEQIKLKDLRHYSKVYAWYYCFKHFIELDTLTFYIIKKRTEELDRVLPNGMRKTIFNDLWEQIQSVKYNKNIQNPNQLAESLVKSVLENPSGCCYFYKAQLRPDGISVRIGCDYKSIKVRSGSNILFEIFYTLGLSVDVNGYELTLIDDKPYIFYSRQMWKLKRQIEMYRFYSENFKE